MTDGGHWLQVNGRKIRIQHLSPRGATSIARRLIALTNKTPRRGGSEGPINMGADQQRDQPSERILASEYIVPPVLHRQAIALSSPSPSLEET